MSSDLVCCHSSEKLSSAKYMLRRPLLTLAGTRQHAIDRATVLQMQDTILCDSAAMKNARSDMPTALLSSPSPRKGGCTCGREPAKSAARACATPPTASPAGSRIAQPRPFSFDQPPPPKPSAVRMNTCNCRTALVQHRAAWTPTTCKMFFTLRGTISSISSGDAVAPKGRVLDRAFFFPPLNDAEAKLWV